jgi:hypothetical protein
MMEHFDVGVADEVPAGIVKRIATDLRLTDDQAAALRHGLKFRAELFNGKGNKGRGETEVRDKIVAVRSALLSASVAIKDLPVPIRERLYEGYRIAAAARSIDTDWQQARDQQQVDLLSLERLVEAAEFAVSISPGDQTGPEKARSTEAAEIVIELLSTVLGRALKFGKASNHTPKREFAACRLLMSYLLPDLVLVECDAPLRTAFKNRPRPSERE